MERELPTPQSLAYVSSVATSVRPANRLNGNINADCRQALGPGYDLHRVEAKLRYDAEPCLGSIGKDDLLFERGNCSLFGEVRTAPGMSDHCDIPDAEPVEDSGLKQVHRLLIGPDRCGNATPNDQDVLDASPLGELSIVPVQDISTGDPTGSKMRDRYAADIFHALCSVENFSMGSG